VDGAEDDLCLFADDGVVNDLVDLMDFAEGEVSPPVMLTSTPVARDRDVVEQRAGNGLLLPRSPDYHRVRCRSPSGRSRLPHDGPHVGEIDVHQAGDADQELMP
jgi:hypothetical protein